MKNKSKNLGKRSSAESEQTKLQILDSALKVFSRYGYDATSLRKIADEAGTTHGLIRHYFGDKMQLYKSVIDYTSEQYLADLAPVFRAIKTNSHLDDPIALAKQSLKLFALGSLKRPEMAKLVLHEAIVESERLDYLYAKVENISRLFAGLFEALQTSGAISEFESLKSYTHFIFFNLPIPLSLNKFSSSFIGKDITKEEELDKYIERIASLLFPNS
ncbi:MAG TPA: TetR/AcrR family transcriptional regulator [Trueperaceae bacterium]|nr:TetR/AcrR family transcriptional regulator [Trueperaceae bacterium]